MIVTTPWALLASTLYVSATLSMSVATSVPDFGVSSSVASHLKAGTLRSLGVTTAKRTSFDPDMPTVAEAVPGFQAFSWNGIVVRTGTPASVIERVGREFASAVQQPQAKEALARILMEPVGSSPAEFRELMMADAARWDRVVSALNLNPAQK